MAKIDRRDVLLGMGTALMAGPAFAREPLRTPVGMSAIPPAWTAAETVPLWDGDPPGAPFAPPPRAADLPETFVTDIGTPALHVFRPARPNGRAILVIPGGAYTFVSIRNEGLDIAQSFTARGDTVFVLTYRLPGEGWRDRADVPLQDAQRAMRKIRALASRYALDPARVTVLGFSAGGHLAASLLTGAAEPVYVPRDATDRLDARPVAGGLIYPVITMTPPYTHAQSAACLLGPAPSAALIARRSPAQHVTAATPPTFLVHAFDDGAVPYQNSVIFADALHAAHRPTELHLFEEGGHGFGLGPANAPAGQWTTLFSAWLARAGG